MILVFIFLGIVIVISILFLILITSTIKIKIENLKLGNIAEKSGEYKILIQIYFLNKIKIFSIKLNNERMRKIYSNKKLEQIDLRKVKQTIPINIETLKIIKGLKLKIESLKLEINVGIEDAIITSYTVAIIASLLSIILPHLVKKEDIKKIKYEIKPIYNALLFNLKLNSIISLKIVHIIYVIYNLVKKGRDKNERTSNRRPYAYSHEFN